MFFLLGSHKVSFFFHSICRFLLLRLLGNTEGLIQDTCTEPNTKYAWHLSLSRTTPESHIAQNFFLTHAHILTGRKVVWSLRCPRSSPKGVPALNCLPLSLRLCGLRLQRPTINRQESGQSEGWEKQKEYTERHRRSGQQTHVRALLCLHYTIFRSYML